MTEDRAPEPASANALIQPFRQVLGAQEGVTLALLFGSRARGDASESSDVDVAVLAPSADLLEIGALLSQVSALEVNVISLADLELDRPWYERMRDAWLERVAQRGV